MRKTGLKSLMCFLLAVLLTGSLARPVSAEVFFISLYVAPPPALTNDDQYDYIRDAHITHVLYTL